ncbi:MAG: transglycosylase domain-containing protein [Actinomycetota bacterium]|nr:transglycosylase domain-containing protein [Actinomycetota bacterium]
MRALRRFILTVAAAGVGVAAATALIVGLGRIAFTSGMAQTNDVLDLQPLAARSVVYARDGSVLQIWHAEEDRVPVTLAQVPPPVVRAVLDAEDDRFYDHGAIDLRALARALVVNVESGGVSEGGSTITQQLVKVTLLNARQDVNRKVQEAALAFRLEERMSKNQILERYLNTVYFGNGAYGLQAAAEKYFSTDVGHLSLGQATLLASLIRDPVGADPFRHPSAALDRRNVVADRMHDLGHTTDVQRAQVKAEALPQPPPEPPARASDYFTEHVKQLLLDDPRLGATKQERTFAIFKGGLSIHTTLDPHDQQTAEDSVAANLPDTGGQFNAAVVSVDPATGAVRALVGGPSFAQSKFNLATDGPGRQPGSAFKAFTLMAALEKGLSPKDSILGSAPCSIPNPGGTPDPWAPTNVEGESAGVLSLTDATVHSINCAYARLVKIVGPEAVVDVAKRMGVTNPLSPNLSITLGSDTVTPLQMASAYATLAADGEHHAPYFIDRVDDQQGKLLFRNTPKADRAVSADNARVETQVLSQVVQRGTGTAAGIPNWGVAGKTGTTDNYANAWFVGYTPALATAVWMGSPDGDVPMRNVGGIRVFGGTYPARIWHDYMAAALANIPPAGFPEPDSYPGGSDYLSIPSEKSSRADSSNSGGPSLGGGAVLPVSPFPPSPVQPPILNIPTPQVTIPAAPRFTIPPISIPQITIPERPTRPSRGG